MTSVSVLPSTTEARDLRKTAANPDYWYPLLSAKKLKVGKAVQVHFAGEPIVLVRTKSGDVFALEDRCAHRQVPLSQGVVADDTIQCCLSWLGPYNCGGWTVSMCPMSARANKFPEVLESIPARKIAV